MGNNVNDLNLLLVELPEVKFLKKIFSEIWSMEFDQIYEKRFINWCDEHNVRYTIINA